MIFLCLNSEEVVNLLLNIINVMKINILIYLAIILTITGCQKSLDCSYLKYDDFEKITLKNNRPYTGKCIAYFINGNKESERTYKKGKDHGKWIFYHSNGNIATKGEMKSGLKIKEWIYYYETGEVSHLQSYDESGSKTGTWLHLEKTGDTISIINY